ncbi:MAG TPA: class I SAM-dependent methyltransferase [Firmicutes bacterium]|nr:class I SAM-dependent methyltransferase [Bacillota bacterium]
MSGYGLFSSFYDRLMSDVDYDGRAAYLLSLFARFRPEKPPAALLDLACGSGGVTLPLAAGGVEMIGVDGSEEMLAKARQKADRQGLRPLFLCQDMRELDLYGTVDGAVCTLDSLNHLCRTADLREVFRRLRLFIEPGGLFLFDVNTPYKHRKVLADNAFVYEEDDFLCVWRNRLLERTCEVDMQLDFFVAQDKRGGCCLRLTDTVRERAYSERTLRRLLAEEGFETLAVYADGTQEPPREDTERTVYAARRRG